MPSFYFCPADDTVGAEAVTEYAARYLAAVAPAHVDDPGVAVDAAPPTLGLDDVLQRLHADAQDAARTHLDEQQQRLEPIADEQLPPLPGATADPLTVGALAEHWQGHPAGTLVAVRQSTPVRAVGVFDEWTIDAAAQLTRTPAAAIVPTPPRAPKKVTAVQLTATDDPGQTFSDVVLTLTNYVGQFLSMTGLPGIGLLITLLSSETQKAVDGSFNRGPGLIDVFKKLLQANRITLENDLAGAVIQNYRDYAHTHYNDAWLDQVMNAPDPLPSDMKDKYEKLEGYVTKITEDFDGTCDLFTAVDTMRVTNPQPGDIHDVTEAMLKAEGFFYMANVALTLGRQAFNAKFTLDGPSDAAKIADLLASYSQIYTDYATALKSTVDQQVARRPGLIHPSEAGGEEYIWDDFYPSPRDGAMAYLAKCCGRGDCDNKARERDRVMAQMKIDRTEQYHKDLCGKFWDGTHQTFDQAVASMQDNNAKLQKLAKDCKDQS